MSQQAYYEQEELWGNEPQGPEAERVEHTLGLIPHDVRTVLDVGCGDGRLSKRMAQTGRMVVGIDLSREALRHVRVPRILGSCDRLPFGDRSFDLVLCSEVLEHLPIGVYRATLLELERVARRYVIIGTPFKERLQERFTRCKYCGATYHVYHHVRSFDVTTFDGLMPGMTVAEQHLCGDKRVVRSRFELWLRQNLGGSYGTTPNAVCPVCGVPGASATPWTVLGLLGEILYRLRRIVARSTAHWLIVVLHKGDTFARGPGADDQSEIG